MTAARATLIVLVAAASAARADGDGRPQDRFYYGLYGGVAYPTAGRFTLFADENGNRLPLTAVDNAAGRVGWVAGVDLSYWACDYFGFGFEMELADFTLPTPSSPSQDVDAMAFRLGPSAKLAVPLRYLQPYVGVSPSMLLVSVRGSDHEATANQLGGVTGKKLVLTVIAGVNFYVNRNLRLFVEYQVSLFDLATSTGDAMASGGDGRGLLYENVLDHHVVTGVSFSPESFREAPSRIKKLMAGGPLAVLASAWVALLILSLV